MPAFLNGVELCRVPSEVTTTFENIYNGTRRVQYVRAVAPPVPISALPDAWRSASVVHLGPIAQEVAPEAADVFPPTTLIGATPQGWLRAWDGDGRVKHIPWNNADHVLERVDVLVFSVEDVGGDLDAVRRYAERARLAVVTENRRGCTVWYRGRRERYPAFRVPEVDPTGAGDVFAAAFLLRFADTHDPATAARFANAAASCAVEGRGTDGIPTLEQVEERLVTGETYP
jgi:sugar/nucleoside kinase (ribokinase family)